MAKPLKKVIKTKPEIPRHHGRPQRSASFEIVVAEDGIPVPVHTDDLADSRVSAYCLVCLSNNASLYISSGGTYILSCDVCSCRLFVKARKSNRLIRAGQRLLKNEMALRTQWMHTLGGYLLADDGS